MPMIFIPRLIRASAPASLNPAFFHAKAPAGGGGGALWTVIASTALAGDGTSSSHTSPAIDTTGANLIMIFNAGTDFVTVSDSKSNSWPSLNDPSGTPRASFRYAIITNPAKVGSGHTFTVSGGSSACIIAFARSGGTPTFDAQASGASGTSGAWTNGSTIHPGLVNPATSADLMLSGIIFDTVTTVTGATVDSSYIIGQSVHGLDAASNDQNLRFAYKIKSDATGENPGWLNGTGVGCDYAMVHAAFS